MAVNDIRSNLLETVATAGALAANGTVTGSVIDTADFELGLMFSLNVSAFTTGTFTLALFEADNVAMTGAVAITGDKLIGTLPVAIAASAEGSDLGTVGVISNLQFVRADVVGTDTSVGTISVIATQKAENMPVV